MSRALRFRGNHLRMALLRFRLAYIIVAVLRSTALRRVVDGSLDRHLNRHGEPSSSLHPVVNTVRPHPLGSGRSVLTTGPLRLLRAFERRTSGASRSKDGDPDLRAGGGQAVPHQRRDGGSLRHPRPRQFHRNRDHRYTGGPTAGRCPKPLGAGSGRENDQGDNAFGLPRDVSELRIALSCFREEAVALVAGGLFRFNVNRLATDLDPRDRVLL
jgi:hypothetical protein